MSAPKMTRRALVAGIAASSIVVPAVVAAPEAHADAELMNLGAAFLEAHAETEKAYDACREAEVLLSEWAERRIPRYEYMGGLFVGVRHDEGFVTLEAIREWNNNTEFAVSHWRDVVEPETRAKLRGYWIKRRQEGKARIAWWREQKGKIDAEHDRLGIPAFEAKADEWDDRRLGVAEQIGAMPAHTLPGLLVKLWVAVGMGERFNLAQGQTTADLGEGWQFVVSALHDAEVLAGARPRVSA